MDLGLSCYQSGDGPLAQRLNARWAHHFADLTEGERDDSDLHLEMCEYDCLPIPDLRTSIQRLATMVAQEEDDLVAARDRAINGFADDVLRYLDRHDHVTRVEIWGSAEVAQFIHGRGELIDYCTILNAVYERVREDRPEVEVWTGGFGCGHGMTADLSMLENALTQYAPESFDACNMHPFIISTGMLDYDENTLRKRLCRARETLDAQCAGQPLVATGFGVPTVDLSPPPEGYGKYWRLFGVRAIPAASAAEWWLRLIDVLSEVGMQTVCLLARDVEPPQRFHHFCGLTHADGSDKAFTEDVCDGLGGA